MARLDNSQIDRELESRITRSGASPSDYGDGSIVTYPPGTPVPTSPTRSPTRPVPVGRSPIGVIGLLTDLACVLYEASPNGFTRELAPSPVPTLSNSTKHGLMQTVCGLPPGPSTGTPAPLPPVPSLQFTGGQCPGVRYTVSYTITYGADPQNPQVDQRTSSRDWIGPLGAISRKNVPPGSSVYRWDLTHDLENPNGPRTDQLAGVGSTNVSPFVGGVIASRQDSQPDDCGNPPPQFDEPIPLPPSPTVTVDPGDGGPPLSFEPSFSFDVGPVGVTLNIGAPDFNIAVDVGGVTLNFNDAAPVSDCPDPCADVPGTETEDPGEPVTPPPSSDPPAEDPSDETGRVIIGAIATLTGGLGGSTEVLSAGGGPTSYFPDLGIIRFKIRLPSGQVGWTSPIKLQQRQQAVEVPWPYGAINVSVLPRPGLSASVKLVYEDIPVQTTA